uniref:Uncharacterized protein n=1 Tax=Cannabis sativa TaxID=3483 RepID=A0A803PMT8_CANSA
MGLEGIAWTTLVYQSKVIKAKYLKNMNFFDLEQNLGDSGMWKAILNSRTLLNNSISKKIGNGDKTSIWFDPWVPYGNTRPTPLKNATLGVAWVKQFIGPNNQWNVHMVREWFDKNDANAILNIDLPEDDMNDNWLWIGEASGNFSIKSACRLITGSTETSGLTPTWKTI